MQFKTIISILFLIPPILLFGDIPHYDIIEVEYKNKKYFVHGYFNEGGVLKNRDLCYYDHNGEYIGEVRDFVLRIGNYTDSITLYTSKENINVTKLSCYEENNLTEPDNIDNILKILNNGVRVSFKDFENNFKLLDAYHGNTGGFTYTPELKESDNAWINNNSIETLFCLNGQDICHYGFFTIKGTLNKKEKQKLESEMKHLIRTSEADIKFWKKISELYKRKIIMMGFCSC
ncbi:MAG: hypothetical protein IT263_05625 [Saprospiraceae bacterium]|nr:hypothetical protein [Saprospiraceae bacterium]